MLIDWFTVGGQIFNFVILVWLLKKFLYKPIISAIASREKRIADEMAEAVQKKSDALKSCDDLAGKNAEFDKEKAALLLKVSADVELERRRLFEQASKSTEGLLIHWKQELDVKGRDLVQEIKAKVQNEVFAISRRVLADLASVDLEDQMTAIFIHRVSELKEEQKSKLRGAIIRGAATTVIRTAFELSSGNKAALQNTINVTFSEAVSIRFETSDALVCGIQLIADGEKLSWSISDYLSALAEEITNTLVTQSRVQMPLS